MSGPCAHRLEREELHRTAVRKTVGHVHGGEMLLRIGSNCTVVVRLLRFLLRVDVTLELQRVPLLEAEVLDEFFC